MSTSYTVGDISTWVSRRLKRADLQDECVVDAYNFYMLLCSCVPFEELETLSAERAMISGTGTYDLSDLSVGFIQSIRLTDGNGGKRRLKRSHTRVYDALNQTATGIPATYARFAKTIEVNPAPNSSSITYRLRYNTLPDDATDTTTMAAIPVIIPAYWHELLRYETLYRTYLNIEAFEKANMLVAPMPMPRQGGSPHRVRVFEYGVIPKLWNDLLRTVKQRENVDEDFSINPVMRRYTFN